jgi:hypothetical protein
MAPSWYRASSESGKVGNIVSAEQERPSGLGASAGKEASVSRPSMAEHYAGNHAGPRLQITRRGKDFGKSPLSASAGFLWVADPPSEKPPGRLFVLGGTPAEQTEGLRPSFEQNSFRNYTKVRPN